MAQALRGLLSCVSALARPFFVVTGSFSEPLPASQSNGTRLGIYVQVLGGQIQFCTDCEYHCWTNTVVCQTLLLASNFCCCLKLSRFWTDLYSSCFYNLSIGSEMCFFDQNETLRMNSKYERSSKSKSNVNLIPWRSGFEERHGRLLLRFRASNAALDVLSGTLAMPRLTLGKTSSALVDTTANGLKEFCTPAGGQLDVPLFKHLREHTQILVTDAAPAELLASQVLRGRRSTGNLNRDQDLFFPSLVLVGRDAPHASMRLLKRPWHVIDDIKQVVQTTITDSESPCQKIFHSPNFSLWFSQATSSHAGPNVSSLSAAKHRFASFAKPMARMIVHLRAFFEVCHRILVSQGDSDSGWVQSWMAEISAKKLLVLACAADGADSLQEMTRHLDTEDCDPATLNETVWIFLHQL